MNSIGRRLRGALVIAVTWGGLWAAIGVALTLFLGIVRPAEIDPGEGPGKVVAVLGLVGFLSGLGFAGERLPQTRAPRSPLRAVHAFFVTFYWPHHHVRPFVRCD